MKIRLTKEFILTALKEENIKVLQPGTWFRNIWGEIEECPRCAVGSVMVRALSRRNEKRLITHAAQAATLCGSNVPNEMEDHDIESEAVRILKEERSPMSALSYYFEGMCQKLGVDEDDIELEKVEEARRYTIVFVDQHFPPTVIVNINGAKPAEDVEVVDDGAA
jgi:hypothetical protein